MKTPMTRYSPRIRKVDCVGNDAMNNDTPIPTDTLQARIANAVDLGTSRLFSADEVLTVYLALSRLHMLEQAGERRDSEAVKALCPTDTP